MNLINTLAHEVNTIIDDTLIDMFNLQQMRDSEEAVTFYQEDCWNPVTKEWEEMGPVVAEFDRKLAKLAKRVESKQYFGHRSWPSTAVDSTWEERCPAGFTFELRYS